MLKQYDTFLSTNWVEIHSVVIHDLLMYRITAYGNQIFYGLWIDEAINNSTLNDHDKNWLRRYFGDIKS